MGKNLNVFFSNLFFPILPIFAKNENENEHGIREKGKGNILVCWCCFRINSTTLPPFTFCFSLGMEWAWAQACPNQLSPTLGKEWACWAQKVNFDLVSWWHYIFCLTEGYSIEGSFKTKFPWKVFQSCSMFYARTNG